MITESDESSNTKPGDAHKNNGEASLKRESSEQTSEPQNLFKVLNGTNGNGKSKNGKKDSQNLSKIELSDSDNQIYLRPQPSGELRVVWYLKGLQRYWEDNNLDISIKSEIFTTPDNCKWRLYLLPNGEPSSKEYVSLFLKAIPNASIGERISMKRDCKFRFWYYCEDKLVGFGKSVETFTSDDSEWGFSKYIKKDTMISNNLNNHLFIEALIDSTVNMDRLKKKMHITAGIKNEGTTCYINSLLQTLFILAPLRKSMFKMPIDDHNTLSL